MLKPAIVLDAELTAADVLERLALNGYWLDAGDCAARQRLQSLSQSSGRSIEELISMLARDHRSCGAAIRRQLGANLLWYAWELSDVLRRCVASDPNALLINVLNLHEQDSQPPIELGQTAPLEKGVVMSGGRPVAVSLVAAASAATPYSPAMASEDLTSRGARAALQTADNAQGLQVWPRIDAPTYAPALTPFAVVVGFAKQQQSGVSGAPVALPAPADGKSIAITVELSAGEGIDALDGWSRPLEVSVDDPTSAQVEFRLVGTEPTNRERVGLTLLEVRYVMGGQVCGIAARPLVILPSTSTDAPLQEQVGIAWNATSPKASPIDLVPDKDVPDLTIEISEPDANVTLGNYVCRLYSPHALSVARGPFNVRLGGDAKTFARQIVDEVRVNASNALLDSHLEAIGRRVGGRLPREFFVALREIAARIAPAVPAVMIVSKEPYVPWELAWCEPPLDHTRPHFLGAQAWVGRWLRDDNQVEPLPGESVVPRPATQPLSRLTVKNLAVMAAWYKTKSGFRRLPMAEKEAKSIVAKHKGLRLGSLALTMRQILTANLHHGVNRIGGIEALHFAGHGDFDPALPDGTALFLEDGTPLSSNVFGSARYGGKRQPLLFLNACMLGIGGEVLGDMGGFPGSSLRGGFGGVLGALWEVDDAVAHDIAIEFWQRALPPPPARGEPVAAILRDLRARYVPDALPAPESTYLSYVYYGHPRLTLTHASA